MPCVERARPMLHHMLCVSTPWLLNARRREVLDAMFHHMLCVSTPCRIGFGRFFLFDLAAATCQGSIVRMLRTWFYCSRDTCHPPRIRFGRFFVLLFSPPTRAKVVYCSLWDPTLISQPIRAVPKEFALGRLARFHSSKVCVR